MKKTSVFIITILFISVGCNTAQNTPNDNSIAKDSSRQSKVANYTITEIASIDIDTQNSELKLLAHQDNKLFYAINSKHLIGAETSTPDYAWYTDAIGVLDISSGEIQWQKSLESENRCTGGALLDETVVYATYSIEPNNEYVFKIIQQTDAVEQEIDRGVFSANFLAEPEFGIVDNTILYTYQKNEQDHSSFGINKIDAHGKTAPVIAFSSKDGDHFIDGTLFHNNHQYLYIVERQGGAYFVLGSLDEIMEEFSLPSDRLINSYSLLSDGILFDFSVDEETDNWHHETLYKPFYKEFDYSNTLTGPPREQISNMNSDCYNTVLYLEESWNPELITLDNHNIIQYKQLSFAELEDVAGEPFSSMSVSRNTFILNYWQTNRLYMLTYN